MLGDEIPGRTSRSFERTTDSQRQCIVEWLEQPGHFQLMTQPTSSAGDTGDDTPPRGSARVQRQCKRLKKADGYRSLMRHVNRCTQARWTQQTARSRFESLLASFKRAKAQQQQQQGEAASTVASNLGNRRSMAMSSSVFERIDALFVQKANGSAPRQLADMADRLTLDDDDLLRTSKPVEHAQLLQLERDRLTLAQQQMQTRQQELELRSQELRAQREMQRESLRAELVARLVSLGKSPEQVHQYLAAMNE